MTTKFFRFNVSTVRVVLVAYAWSHVHFFLYIFLLRSMLVSLVFLFTLVLVWHEQFWMCFKPACTLILAHRRCTQLWALDGEVGSVEVSGIVQIYHFISTSNLFSLSVRFRLYFFVLFVFLCLSLTAQVTICVSKRTSLWSVCRQSLHAIQSDLNRIRHVV